jgi:hypothetical protein
VSVFPSSLRQDFRCEELYPENYKNPDAPELMNWFVTGMIVTYHIFWTKKRRRRHANLLQTIKYMHTHTHTQYRVSEKIMHTVSSGIPPAALQEVCHSVTHHH